MDIVSANQDMIYLFETAIFVTIALHNNMLYDRHLGYQNKKFCDTITMTSFFNIFYGNLKTTFESRSISIAHFFISK